MVCVPQCGSSEGGSPITAPGALANLRYLLAHDLRGNAAKVGPILLDGLRELGSPIVGDVRGKGLMIGIELDRPCGDLVERGLEAGLLINVTADTVVRLLPPLNMKDAEVQLLIEGVSSVIRIFLTASRADAAVAH